jgi:tetratricopeptide (TPR) repeat protein
VSLREAIDRADALRHGKRFEEAAIILTEAMQSPNATSSGDRAELLFRLGNVWIDGDDLDRAEEAYAEAVDLDPKHADALNNLAIVYKRQGRRELFVRTYRRSIWLAARRPRWLRRGCKERSPGIIILRWVLLLLAAFGVIAVVRWLFPG